MQSLFTIIIAGCLAFIGVLMMNPEPEPSIDIYADLEPAQLVSATPDVPSVVVEPVQPLVLALDAYPYLDGSMDLPADALLSLSE